MYIRQRFICYISRLISFIFLILLLHSKYIGDFIYIAIRYCRYAPSGRMEEGWWVFIRSPSRLIQLECRRRWDEGRVMLSARYPWVFCSYPRHGLPRWWINVVRTRNALFVTWLIEQSRNDSPRDVSTDPFIEYIKADTLALKKRRSWVISTVRVASTSVIINARADFCRENVANLFSSSRYKRDFCTWVRWYHRTPDTRTEKRSFSIITPFRARVVAICEPRCNETPRLFFYLYIVKNTARRAWIIFLH